MRIAVVGAGAWGLPAASQLAQRGHQVLLVDRYGPANPRSSSPGPTRIWRLAHPDVVRVRLAKHSLAAMERLEHVSGTTVFLRRGLLWRDTVAVPRIAEALAAEDVEFALVPAVDVGRFFPGLRPDGRDAIWQPEAGIVLADAALRAQLALFEAAGGRTAWGRAVAEVEQGRAEPSDGAHGAAGRGGLVRLHFEDGAVEGFDRVVLTPGPEAQPLLATLGVRLPLRPQLEQVAHFGDPEHPGSTDDLPCLVEGPTDTQPGSYAMPTPGAGYKLGIDEPIRRYDPADADRTPDAGRLAEAQDRIRRDFGAVPPTLLDAQVCSWTESPDGRFVIDTVGDVVLACGDSGEGFKFSALMGEVLADLAEGRPPVADISSFTLDRFPADIAADWVPHVLGR
ncbi:MAG: pyridine nucleotide-disulfide oxidoreductase [Naasia sp.]|nr:pyridine nucleotide-disulfide oxidoreductase [Naasia sp.]